MSALDQTPEILLVPRDELCRDRTWCLLPDRHRGACVEVPRYKLPSSDFGPRRSKR